MRADSYQVGSAARAEYGAGVFIRGISIPPPQPASRTAPRCTMAQEPRKQATAAGFLHLPAAPHFVLGSVCRNLSAREAGTEEQPR